MIVAWNDSGGGEGKLPEYGSNYWNSFYSSVAARFAELSCSVIFSTSKDVFVM